MKRRQFIKLIAAMPLALTVAGWARWAWAAGDKSIENLQKNWKSLLARDAKVALSTEPIQKSKAEWKKILTDSEFYILRQEGTERPYTSRLNDEKRPGLYVCVGCALPLFTSEMKYDSRTGWPSFITNIPGHLGTKRDFKLFLPRTEYHCLRCGGHHGHLFSDGPPPTRERWCNNGVALRFIPA